MFRDGKARLLTRLQLLWHAEHRHEVLVGLAIGCLVALLIGWTVYVAIRITVSYRTEAQVIALQSRMLALETRHTDDTEANREWIGVFARYLWGDLAAVPQKPEPPRIVNRGPEVWQRNQTAELQKQIQSLQRLNLSLEARVYELERKR